VNCDLARGGEPKHDASRNFVAGRQTPEGLAAAADMAATVDIGLAMAAVQPLVRTASSRFVCCFGRLPVRAVVMRAYLTPGECRIVTHRLPAEPSPEPDCDANRAYRRTAQLIEWVCAQVDRGADDTVAFAEWAMGGGSKGSPAGTPAAGLERRRSSADGASRRRSGSRLRVSSASLHTIAEGAWRGAMSYCLLHRVQHLLTALSPRTHM